jgi:hypothetical protein
VADRLVHEGGEVALADRLPEALQVLQDLARDELLHAPARAEDHLEVELEVVAVRQRHDVLQVAVLVDEARLAALDGELVAAVPDRR